MDGAGLVQWIPTVVADTASSALWAPTVSEEDKASENEDKVADTEDRVADKVADTAACEQDTAETETEENKAVVAMQYIFAVGTDLVNLHFYAGNKSHTQQLLQLRQQLQPI